MRVKTYVYEKTAKAVFLKVEQAALSGNIEAAKLYFDLIGANFEQLPEDPILQDSIDSLALSCRTFNVLRSAGINQISQLLAYSKNGLFQVPLLGRKSINEIAEKMAEMDLFLASEPVNHSATPTI